MSKKINLHHAASVDNVREIIRYARERDVMEITVFRSGTKSEQVLEVDPVREECIGECESVAERSV